MAGHSGTIPITVGSGDKPRPFRGKAATIPGVIIAGHYDEGGQGVAYRDTTPGNVFSDGWRRDDGVDGREHSVGGVVAGEWVRYTVDIRKSGCYRLKFKYGTPSPFPHKVEVLLDGVRVSTLGPLPRHAADDWSTDTVAEADIKLPSGRHVLTLHLIGQFNFTDFEFVDAKR